MEQESKGQHQSRLSTQYQAQNAQAKSDCIVWFDQHNNFQNSMR